MAADDLVFGQTRDEQADGHEAAGQEKKPEIADVRIGFHSGWRTRR